MMRKITSYIVLVVFAGIAILLLSAYLKWIYLDFQSDTVKKAETDLTNIKRHMQVDMYEILYTDVNASPARQIIESPEQMRVLVVPYFETSSLQWQILYEEADKNPGVIKYAIINPCSGPCGKSLSQEWQQIISELKKRNIKTLGYIFDTFQSIENIDHYMKAQIPTDGIFFDNEGSSDTLERFRPYAQYVRSIGGIVYINPGFNYEYLREYANSGLVDVINAYEFESSKSHHMEIDKNTHPQKVSAILGDVHSVSEMTRMVNDTAVEGVGIVYVYSDSYHVLPQFFSELIKEAAVTKVKLKSN